MPELVAGGPRIPVRLLNEVGSGKVVFFCGAGVSMGPGSVLPGFKDLVRHVYAKNGISPDKLEKRARKVGALDKVLGLLEREERLGMHALRQTVIRRLSVPPRSELCVHKALIDLSRTKQGVRLITTNFDDRFVEAGLDEKLVDTAPKLPIPKPHSWSSLVHLHGRVSGNEDSANLVLTAADFGRAYLTERWAARFVTELFREFTVVFVGYSVSDPVMGYLVDALAAERAKGARFAGAYAFAESNGSETGNEKASNKWRAKNIEPILYDRREKHRLLEETLVEWARIRRDPFHARSRIAINELSKMPAGTDDPVVERVIWALEDPVAVKALADEPPIKNESEYAKFETWLDLFTAKGLLFCTVYEIDANEPDQRIGEVHLVDSGFGLVNPNKLDKTRIWLTKWLASHIHVPQLLGWVLRNGGHLHPLFRDEIERSLANEALEIPERLRLLWTILLDNRPVNPWKDLWTTKRYKSATTDGERRRIEEEAVESIAPRLIVRPGPEFGLTFQQDLDPIKTCGHLELVLGENNDEHGVREILHNGDVMSRYAMKLTQHLEKAIDLCKCKEDHEVYLKSYLYRPSIASHEQNNYHHSWVHLIDLVRDSYAALADRVPKCAANLLLWWTESQHPLFRRLALHALTENPNSDIHLARNLLLKGRQPGLWESEMHRELMRFLRLAGKRLPQSLRVDIVRAINVGPKTNNGFGPFGNQEDLRYEKALRLRKLKVSGARLDTQSKALADEAAGKVKEGEPERDEFLLWREKAQIIGPEEFAPKKLVDGMVADVVAELAKNNVGEKGFRGLIAVKRTKAVSALRHLAKQGIWPASYWEGFLWHLASLQEDRKFPSRLRGHVAGLLVELPDRLFKNIGSAAAAFVNRMSKEYGTDQEDEFKSLWMKAWIGKNEVEPEASDPEDRVIDALNHPAGRLAEAALTRMAKYGPQAGAGIPRPVRVYFDLIGRDPCGDLGRVMLSTRLNYLFTIDSVWASEHIIARLSPWQSPEAGGLWSAFGWSPRLGPDLLKALVGAFLEILRNEESEVQWLDNLRSLFVTICLEAPEEMTEQEIRSVVDTLSEEGLKTLLLSLRRRLVGEPVERDRIWCERVHPWLLKYWPPAAVRNTSATSEDILKVLAECGDAFPNAVRWSIEYLRPFKGKSLYWLNKNGFAEQHPDAMLQVLDRVVDADILPSGARYSLGEILGAMVGARVDIAQDQRFQRLYEIANR